MGRGPDRHELILLFDKTGKEPKALHKWLQERNQPYSYSTCKKYFQYYATDKLIIQSIMDSPIINIKKEDKK